jgi:hypothetical protein
MSPRLNTKLLSLILEGQEEGRVPGILTEERARAALTSGPPLTQNERRLIWMSPDARDLFLSVRRSLRAELSDRVREAGLGVAERRLAASGGDIDEVAGAGFTVTIFKDDGAEGGWSISVQLEDAYTQLIGPNTTVLLRDSGGVAWATGVPDSRGCIGGIWQQAGESPRTRLQKFSLLLEP